MDEVAVRPSALLATSNTGLFSRRSHCAKCRSAGVRPARASTTNSTRSAVRTELAAPWRMRPARVSGAASSNPAVSIRRAFRPRNMASASLLSRVTPGVSATKAARLPASRLNSVDLPTLGRPAMTTVVAMSAPGRQFPVLCHHQQRAVGDDGGKRRRVVRQGQRRHGLAIQWIEQTAFFVGAEHDQPVAGQHRAIPRYWVLLLVRVPEPRQIADPCDPRLVDVD